VVVCSALCPATVCASTGSGTCTSRCMALIVNDSSGSFQ
jgi:hypothetical protein